MVSTRCVKSNVAAPRRADAEAASQPACPPPMMITSNSVMMLYQPIVDHYRRVGACSVLDPAKFRLIRQVAQALSSMLGRMLGKRDLVAAPTARAPRTGMFHVKQSCRLRPCGSNVSRETSSSGSVRSAGVFHVKHSAGRAAASFANTKTRENRPQHRLNADNPGQLRKRIIGDAQILSCHFGRAG